MEKTLILIKPDGVVRGLIGEIVGRFEKKGLKLSGLKFIQVTSEMAHKHYSAHVDKPFFQGLVNYITSSPVVAMAWEGPDAVAISRRIIGATNPANADPGTIRGDLALSISNNLVHGSDSLDSAKKELEIFFDKEEILSWDRPQQDFIVGS